MQKKGIRVISAVDSTRAADGGEAYGVFRIEDDGSIRHLATPILKWGKLYEILIKSILEGTYHSKAVDRKDQATNYWWGMISGVVDIRLADGISPYTAQLVDILKSDIIHGAMNPFDGELRSRDRLIKRRDDASLSSRDIILMDWLNENIEGEIPDTETLTETARETVSVSGVKQ